MDLQYSQLKAEGIKLGPTEEMLTEEVLSTQSDPDLLTQLCNRVQLWPAMEHLALLWQYKLTADCVNTACLTR